MGYKQQVVHLRQHQLLQELQHAFTELMKNSTKAFLPLV
jgi:hypothetical protein